MLLLFVFYNESHFFVRIRKVKNDGRLLKIVKLTAN